MLFQVDLNGHLAALFIGHVLDSAHGFRSAYVRPRRSVMVTELLRRKLIFVSLGRTAGLPRVVRTAPVPAAPPAPAPIAAPFPPPAAAPIIVPRTAPAPILAASLPFDSGPDLVKLSVDISTCCPSDVFRR